MRRLRGSFCQAKARDRAGMNGKQADAVLSDLLMKCDEQGVELPAEAIAALRGAVGHEMGRSQMQKALEQLKAKFEVKIDDPEASASHAPRLVRRQKRMLMQDLPKCRGNGSASGSSGDEDFIRRPAALDAMSPKMSSKKQRYAKKSRIQEQVEATPATHEANQSLVDLLVQLGDFEMHHGHTQRGLSRIRAAKQIRDSKEVITSGAQARRLDRVGPSVAAKVDQLLNEGLEKALREYSEEDTS
ncbi:hypothetical protein BBJ28_00018324 [Nothophytophthora sp. Chile5]|nr:hypothetical protein BBJ28_00018324 [Nothophytophthora sp. Chile5]